MTTEEFEIIINKQLQKCLSTLVYKAHEYATEDRLHNFKVAAELQNCTNEQALGGMMAKHTVSIYDMIRDTGEGVEFLDEAWDEKITDHINYLLLLQAIIKERK